MDKSLINGTSLLNGLVMGIPNGNLVIVNRYVLFVVVMALWECI